MQKATRMSNPTTSTVSTVATVLNGGTTERSARNEPEIRVACRQHLEMDHFAGEELDATGHVRAEGMRGSTTVDLRSLPTDEDLLNQSLPMGALSVTHRERILRQ